MTEKVIPKASAPTQPAATHGRNPLRSIISGGLTGGIEICITYPTEFVKTHMQLYPEDQKKGIPYCVKKTIKERGVRGLYRGLAPLLLFSVPKVGCRFGTNEWLKGNVFPQKNRITTFLCGLGAGISEAVFVVTPTETLKVKLIHDRLREKSQYKNMFDGIGQIYKAEGFWGIYRGVVPTVLKQGSNQGVRFLIYEDTSALIRKYLGWNKNATNILAGALAGMGSVLVNTPMDVVKTVMQGLDAKKYGNFANCFLHIVKTEGIMGLYKGTVARASRVVADVAITFFLYDIIHELLNSTWPEKH